MHQQVYFLKVKHPQENLLLETEAEFLTGRFNMEFKNLKKAVKSVTKACKKKIKEVKNLKK
jgi:hypothetical protein